MLSKNKLHVIKSILSFQSKCCPYCKSFNTIKFGKNSPLSHIRECKECSLIYRWPKQDLEFNDSFYQDEYSKIHKSIATELPAEDCDINSLDQTIMDHRDYTIFTKIFRDLMVCSILDYGCSWGYGVKKFSDSGFKSYGYEISKPRANYGIESLGVNIFNKLSDFKSQVGTVDVVYCSHVIEHLPDPSIALKEFSNLLNDNGWLFLIVPNCGGDLAKELREKWGPFSSSIHPLSYTSKFFDYALPLHNFDNIQFFSEPYSSMNMLHIIKENITSETGAIGEELLVVARKKSNP